MADQDKRSRGTIARPTVECRSKTVRPNSSHSVRNRQRVRPRRRRQVRPLRAAESTEKRKKSEESKSLQKVLRAIRLVVQGFAYVWLDNQFVMLGSEPLGHYASRFSLVEISRENPMVKVFTGLELARAIRATMVDESTPPLSKAPRGTSLDQANPNRLVQSGLQLLQIFFFRLRPCRPIRGQVPIAT